MGKFVLGYFFSNVLTVIGLLVIGVFGGAYLELFFKESKSGSWGSYAPIDATIDFTTPRTFRAYYGSYNHGTTKTDIVDAIISLREGSRTGKLTGTKTRLTDNGTARITGFINGRNIVLTQRGDSDRHGAGVIFLQIVRDPDNHDLFFGYQISEDQKEGSQALFIKKCPILLIEEAVFNKNYKGMDKIRARYRFLGSSCADFDFPEPLKLSASEN